MDDRSRSPIVSPGRQSSFSTPSRSAQVTQENNARTESHDDDSHTLLRQEYVERERRLMEMDQQLSSDAARALKAAEAALEGHTYVSEDTIHSQNDSDGEYGSENESGAYQHRHQDHHHQQQHQEMSHSPSKLPIPRKSVRVSRSASSKNRHTGTFKRPTTELASHSRGTSNNHENMDDTRSFSKLSTRSNHTEPSKHKMYQSQHVSSNRKSMSGHTSEKKPHFKLSPTFVKEVDKDLPVKAQLSFLSAQLRIAHEEFSNVASYAADLSDQVSMQQKQQQREQAELKRLRRLVHDLELERDSSKKHEKDMSKRLEDLSKQLDTVRREATDTAKAARQADDSAASKDVRLNRALDANSRLRERVKELEQIDKDRIHEERDTVSSLRAQLRKLELQRAELITGFKKQLRLIDILKRQKIHMEAARMLAFTEEEFTQAIQHGQEML